MLLFFVSFSYAFAASGAPTTLSFQGRLYDASGNLLGGAGTTYYFKFSLWDNPTVGSGSRLWPASAPTSFPSIVKSGVFNVNIGDTADGYPDALNYNFNTNSTIYLQIEVSSDNVTFQTLSPRQLITAAAFAQLAGAVSGVGQSSFGTTTPIANSVVSIVSTSTNSTALTIGGFFGQVADLFDVQNSTGNNLFSINANGSTTIANLTAGIVRSTASGQLYTDTNSYLTSAEASSTYASTTWVASTFEPIALLQNDYVSTSTFSGTLASYLTSATAANIYLPLSASTSLAYIPFASSSLYYLASNPEGFISTTSIAADYVSTSTFSTTLNSYLSTTSASQIYLPLSASTSLAYVATETDPFFEAASSSLPYYIPAASSSLYLLNSASTSLAYIPFASSSLYYLNSNPSNYITATTSSLTNYVSTSTITNYLTTATAASTYLPLSASTSLAYIPFASSSLYYLNSNPSNYITATTSSLTNYVSTSSFANTLLGYLSTTSAAANYVSTSTITNYLTTATAASTYLPLSASTSLAYIPFASSTLYVPYSNATGGVNLNNNALANVSTLSVGSATAPTGGVAYFNGNVAIGTTSPADLLTVQDKSANEVYATSSNLLLVGDSISGTHWSGSNLTWTHATGTGFTQGLADNTWLPTSGNYYQTAYTISGVSTGTVSISFGGVTYAANVSVSGVSAPFAAVNSTGHFTVTPTANFDGTITFAVYQVTPSPGVFSILDTTGLSDFEIRSSPQSLLNTFVGVSAGGFNTTGNGNTALGDSALYFNQTGSNQVAIGYGALQNTNGTNYNTAVGYGALQLDSNGSSNTAVGYLALNTKPTSNNSNNTAVGYEALQKTTGAQNVGMGLQALFNETSGGSNTAFGYTAMNSLTTGSNDLGLGYNVQPLANSDNNEIVIGNGTTGLGSNTTVIGNASTTLTALYGNVAVGTTTAASILTIQGTSTTPLLNIMASSTNSALYVSNVGNVGIGTASPLYPLQVVATNSGTSTNVMELQNNSATTGSGVNLRFEDTSADGSLTNGLTYLNAVRQSDGSMNFEIYNAPGSNGTPNANLTIIGDTGDLGIGTTSPSQTLTVVGSGSQDIFNVASSSGISDLYVTSAGDVGVGTSTPVAIFDVNSGNNAIPSKFIESDVSRSTFFDSQIPTNNFVFDDISNAAGSQLRFRSKPFADLGQNNGVTQNILNLEGDTGYVGIGTTNPQQTLDMVAGGTYGYNGTQVIIASTTAFDYFFGDAGNLSTTGVSNTAIGHDALIAVGIGGYNTAIGDITLASDASGSNNTGIGRAALEVDSSGGGNTAVGRSALYYNTTTNNNTALGYQAGEFASGSSSIENQISSNSLYLGYLTSPLVSGDTNEIVIGENTVGLGSNTTVIGSSTATTLTAIPAGVFDIGTTTASTTFYVAGSGLLATIGDGGTSNTTAGLEMGGGRALFGYNGTDNAVSIEGGNAKGIEFLVGGTSGTFPDGGTDAMTILGSGNIGYVGIGTSTPTSLLTVWGNLSVGTSTSPLLLVNSATGILTINSPLGSEGLTLETNGSARVSLSATTGSVLGSLSFGASQSIGWGASANFGNADVGLARYTAGVLQVTGNALNNFSTLIAGNLDVPISTPAIPTIASSTIGGTLSAGTYWFKVSASDGIGSTTPSAEVTATTTGTTGSITLTIAAVTGAASYNIYFSTTTAGNELAYFSTTTTTFVFATTSGATNLPSGVPTVTNAYADKIASSSNSWFDGGDVGIGTSNPIDILNIAGTNNNGITLSGTNPTISMNSSNYLRIGNGLWYYYGNAGNTWQLYDSKGGAQRFVVAADTGNVLIPTGTLTVGSTTAQSALGFVYIQATSSSNTAPLLTVATSTGATYLTVLANGNVGIGTSNPQNALTLTSGDTFVTSMATPATPAIASSTTGGNLTSGTYWFKVSASDGIGTTTPSAEVTTTTTGTTGSITLTIAAVTGAASYNIYFSTTTAGNELAYFSTTTTTFVFATTSGATNGTVPTVTNAYINKISASGTSWLDGGAVAINENPTNIPAGFGLTIGGGPTGVNPTIYFGNSSNWQRYATFEMYNSNFAMYNTQTSVYQFLDTPTGLMGLNTSTPTSILYVQASSTTNTSPLFTVASSSSAVFTVLASGNTGIGTTSPAYALTVAASSTGQIQMIDTAGAAGDYWYIGDAASNTFDVFDQGNAGVYMTNGGTSWTSASDERLKTNITTLGTSTLDEVLALNPVTYNWIATSSSQAEQVGFIAQQVAAAGLTDVVVMPSNPNDCVPGDVNQSDCYGLDYDRFAPYLVKAIQVQQGFIGTIETFINNLANGIAHLADIFVEQLTVGTQAAPSSSGITMYDHATGQPYCVFINNGVWTNSAGACGTATSTSDITDTASVGSAGGDSSSESSASSSDATMTDDTFATSTASTTDETVATSTATSTPDIIATSTPEIIPDDSASSTDTTDTSGDLSTSTDASSTGQ